MLHINEQVFVKQIKVEMRCTEKKGKNGKNVSVIVNSCISL